MIAYCVIGVAAVVAAVVQVTMGFGAAIILLNVMPLFWVFNKAVAVTQASVLVLNGTFTLRYWRRIRWDVLWPALVPASILGLVFTIWSVRVDVGAMTIALGVAFVVLAVYEVAISERVRVRPTRAMGVLMGSASGVTNALFGIAGPPVIAYFVPSIEDKIEYVATSQAFFMMASIPCIVARLVEGVYQVSDLPVLVVVCVGLLVGMVVGIRILKRIDSQLLRKLIYIFIGLNGVYLIVKQIV